jgi:hypothetical protein
VLIVAAVVIGGGLGGEMERRWDTTGAGPVLLALTVAGAFATVPETKHVTALLGAAVFLPLLGWPVALGAVGRVGWFPALGLLLWAGAVDGATRPASIIGVCGCLGLVAVEPVATALAGRSPLQPLVERLPGAIAVVPVAALHLGLVYVASRVAGLKRDELEAAVIVAVALVVATIAAFAVARAGDEVDGR